MRNQVNSLLFISGKKENNHIVKMFFKRVNEEEKTMQYIRELAEYTEAAAAVTLESLMDYTEAIRCL